MWKSRIKEYEGLDLRELGEVSTVVGPSEITKVCVDADNDTQRTESGGAAHPSLAPRARNPLFVLPDSDCSDAFRDRLPRDLLSAHREEARTNSMQGVAHVSLNLVLQVPVGLSRLSILISSRGYFFYSIKNFVKLQGGEYISSSLERLASTYKSCQLVSNIYVYAIPDATQPISVIFHHEGHLRAVLPDAEPRTSLGDLCTNPKVKALQ